MSAQIFDVEKDLLDPQLRYVEKDVRLSALTIPADVARRSANSPVLKVSSPMLPPLER
jgi:hypothetical protein